MNDVSWGHSAAPYFFCSSRIFGVILLCFFIRRAQPLRVFLCARADVAPVVFILLNLLTPVSVVSLVGYFPPLFSYYVFRMGDLAVEALRRLADGCGLNPAVCQTRPIQGRSRGPGF